MFKKNVGFFVVVVVFVCFYQLPLFWGNDTQILLGPRSCSILIQIMCVGSSRPSPLEVGHWLSLRKWELFLTFETTGKDSLSLDDM